MHLTSFRQLICIIYQMQNEPAWLDRYLRELKTVDALLVDELRYRVTNWCWQQLHDVFDYRYQRRITTCIVSNYSSAALEGNALRLAQGEAITSAGLSSPVAGCAWRCLKLA